MLAYVLLTGPLVDYYQNTTSKIQLKTNVNLMMYNNQNPYCSIFIVPNKEAMKRWLEERNVDPGSEEGKIEALKELEKQIYEFSTGGKYQEEFPQRWLPAQSLFYRDA